MFEPIKLTVGDFMGRYFAALVPTTPALLAYKERPLERAIAWAPGRMVDYAETMLASWQRNATDAESGVSITQGFGKLPLVTVAMAKDLTLPDDAPPSEPGYVTLPEDPKQRVFQLHVVTGELRVQVVFFASEAPTALSMATQFLRFAKLRRQRDASALFCFAGFPQAFPVRLLAEGSGVDNVPNDHKNLSIAVVDLAVRANVPFFAAPDADTPHDGQGIPGTDDPPGFLLVDTVNRSLQGVAA